ATAERASDAAESTMAICVSASGGSRIKMFLPVTSDQPAGTVKVAPALVARGVSEVSRSGADLTSAAGADVCRVVAVTDVTSRARTANRIVRWLDIGTP